MENHIKSEEYDKNPVLDEVVVSDTELKGWLVNYVGTKLNPEDGNVTVEMIVETISEEFPEFLLAVAEENFIRGYKQCFVDIEANKSDA